MLGYDWPAFDRVTVEGTAERIDPDDPRYDGYFEVLTAKNWLSSYFTGIGNLYRIAPKRITVVLGLGPERHTLDFD